MICVRTQVMSKVEAFLCLRVQNTLSHSVRGVKGDKKKIGNGEKLHKKGRHTGRGPPRVFMNKFIFIKYLGSARMTCGEEE